MTRAQFSNMLSYWVSRRLTFQTCCTSHGCPVGYTWTQRSGLLHKGMPLPGAAVPRAWWAHSKHWLPFPFCSSPKCNRKTAIQCTHIISLRLFLGIPFIAFPCHYMGIQNIPFKIPPFILDETTLILYLAYMFTHTCCGEKSKYTQMLTALQSRATSMGICSQKKHQ